MGMCKLFLYFSYVWSQAPIQVNKYVINKYLFGMIEEITIFGDFKLILNTSEDSFGAFLETAVGWTEPSQRLVNRSFAEDKFLVMPCKFEEIKLMQTVS